MKDMSPISLDYPQEWNAWLALPRPRRIHWRRGHRFWTSLIIAVPTLTALSLVGILIAEWRVHPPRGSFKSDVLAAAPFIVLGLFFSFSACTTLTQYRGLVREGELVIGRVVGVRAGCRRSRTVTYEFLDRSGRLITTSCQDQSRSFVEGMPLPVFYDFANPEKKQVAWCATPFEPFVALSSGKVEGAS